MRDDFLHLPGLGEFAGFTLGAALLTCLAVVSVSLRFEEVDLKVQTRELQAMVRKAETEEIQLRNDVARWQRGDYLKSIAEESLAMQPAEAQSLGTLVVNPQVLNRFEAAEQVVAARLEDMNLDGANKNGSMPWTFWIKSDEPAEEVDMKMAADGDSDDGVTPAQTTALTQPQSLSPDNNSTPRKETLKEVSSL
jgi:hypothetical protein